jgi:hypothetical protein
VLVKFPDMTQVEAWVYDEKESRESVKMDSDESIRVIGSRLAIMIRQCLV